MWFSAPSFWMGGGLESRCVGRVYGADGAARHHTHEYSDFTKLEFESYIVQEQDHQINTFRLLDTDNRIVLSINSPIRIIVTAADVLHS